MRKLPTGTIRLCVVGTPAPQGSKTGYYNPKTKHVAVVEGSSATGRQKTKAWRQDVRTAAVDYAEAVSLTEPLEGPLAVRIAFVMPKPKSAPKYKTTPDKKPDLDKLVRATFDSLSKVIYRDDAQVVDLHVSKRYEGEGYMIGAEILVLPVPMDFF